MPLIFAYGSNMNWQQMRERCPSVEFVCNAKLKDHSLAFTRKSTNRDCGVSDVVSADGKDVWGVVYQVSDADMPNLDRKEGINSNSYVRRVGTVYQNDDEAKPMTVDIYFAVRQENPPLPNQEYKNLIVSGAKFWNLPAEYITELENIEVA